MGERKLFSARKAEPGQLELARQELEESLAHTRVLIAQAYSGFNAADDPELVESFIYEIMALQCRYSYLLRSRKALEAPAPVRAAEVLPAV